MQKPTEKDVNLIRAGYWAMLQNLENDEVLYTDEARFKQYLADCLAVCDTVLDFIKTQQQQIITLREDCRQYESRIEAIKQDAERVKSKNSELMIKCRFLEDEYYNKPAQEIIKVVHRHTEPRDYFDMNQHATIAANHLFRLMHDPAYEPEKTFAEKYKYQTLKTTTHLEV